MSAKYATVEKYYTLGVWDERKVRDAVEKGWITKEEFKTLTGKKY